MTATPNRTDRKPILKLVDNNLIYQITQREAIERGFLCPFCYYALKDNINYSNIRHNGFRYYLDDLNRLLIIKRRDQAIIKKYKSLIDGVKAIAFCVSIQHTIRASNHFNDEGIPSVAIHSGLTNEQRKKHIRNFREGKYQIAFVRDMFNEGIDFPEVGALLFLRPTESKIIFTQQLGRGLRIYPGKENVKVLDFIGNFINNEKIIDYLGTPDFISDKNNYFSLCL